MASNNFNKKILQIGDQSKQIYKQSVILREHHMVLSYLQGHVWQRGGESHQSHSMILRVIAELAWMSGTRGFWLYCCKIYLIPLLSQVINNDWS